MHFILALRNICQRKCIMSERSAIQIKRTAKECAHEYIRAWRFQTIWKDAYEENEKEEIQQCVFLLTQQK